jgi:putative inorganic carbon (hco3(-)) transporter
MTKEKVAHILDIFITYCLCALVFFIPISKAIIEAHFAFAAVAFIIRKLVKPDFKFLKDYSYLFILLFIFFNTLSFINSGVYLNKSLHALFLKWCKYIFVFVVAENTLCTKKRLKAVMLVLLTISTFMGVDALFQLFRGLDFFRNRALIGGRVTAAFENQNSFSSFLVPTFLFVIALVFQPMLIRFKLFMVFLASLLCTALILTFSRSAWFAFSLGLIFLTILSGRSRQYMWTIGIWASLLLLLPAAQQRIYLTFLPLGDADRIALWASSWRMIQTNPFLGKGVGTYMAHFRQYADFPRIYYAHNCFLQIWAEAGIFSLLAFLSFVSLIMYRSIKELKSNSNFLTLGLACGIFGFLVHSFFDVSLYSVTLAYLFWSMLGILSGLTKFNSNPENRLTQLEF